ncbi:MAG TPA: class I SAM-dependent methyltransferase [Candidatus Thermoplasmatota archaeon]|nr:class I SAM-dependent methyltransferase [Candidatus Thermoplasmatota archaeon]
MRRPYGKSAGYYDAFYSERVDYEGDVRFLFDVFKRHGAKKPKKLLDLGAGTCSHALLLAQQGVEVDAVDVSEPLLDVAEEKIKDAKLGKQVRLHRMDMTKKLPEGKFDAAVSMFGAWCYLRTDEDASKTMSMLTQRLPKGGLFVFEFWSPLGWQPQQNWTETDLPDGTHVVRLTRPSLELKDDVYEFEMEHIAVRDGKLIDNFSEGHGLRLRTPFQTRALLARNGFEVLAMTKGGRDAKSLEPMGPTDFRVMCIARRA